MFKGSLPAMITPFNNGKVDVKTLRNLVNWHIEQGSHGLVPVGTTGESPTLTHAEHEQVVSEVINEANKIYDVENVIPSIYLVSELSRNKI